MCKIFLMEMQHIVALTWLPDFVTYFVIFLCYGIVASLCSLLNINLNWVFK